ncbi:uncharacterized protein TRAVEDRAFT_30283 [Trametes versicolor FP-101664 SS1]|uniref:uncharacterized protein n=1 Tax=Trametes versicolor (strain FP-101664) TaxID=717944 RepID=UPI000462190C|nr:uncharacterized protein TRAVEDRAFT_30283 [Trametes versicolor FP-101664 SS1]EIW57058.1 hypothetical protein TRAVEDRAFT_30283 [Trametes versicolor FP-101664 SS1]
MPRTGGTIHDVADTVRQSPRPARRAAPVAVSPTPRSDGMSKRSVDMLSGPHEPRRIRAACVGMNDDDGARLSCGRSHLQHPHVPLASRVAHAPPPPVSACPGTPTLCACFRRPTDEPTPSWSNIAPWASHTRTAGPMRQDAPALRLAARSAQKISRQCRPISWADRPRRDAHRASRARALLGSRARMLNRPTPPF